MASSIVTKEQRARLKVRRDPYWSRVREGCYVGYRRLKQGEGTWHARWRDESGKQHFKALGTFIDGKTKAFDQATKEATKWFDDLQAGVTPQSITVQDACDQFVRHLRSEDGDAKADGEQARLERLVFHDPIANIELGKLRQEHVKAWRQRLRGRPSLVTRTKNADAEQVTRARAASTINRDMVPLRAALNHAKKLGQVATDIAWNDALKAIKGADGRRGIYLDRAERRLLLQNASEEVRPFLTALNRLPLRPGAMARLTVGDFNKKLNELRIGKEKKTKERRILLPPTAADLFKPQTKNKLPTAPLFARANGAAWDKDSWKVPIKEAAAAAKLPTATVANTIRHSVITDLVTGGLDLFTVAQISGTSVAMIERHYGHLRKQHAADALAKLAL